MPRQSNLIGVLALSKKDCQLGAARVAKSLLPGITSACGREKLVPVERVVMVSPDCGLGLDPGTANDDAGAAKSTLTRGGSFRAKAVDVCTPYVRAAESRHCADKQRRAAKSDLDARGAHEVT
jgi:hypothetical protein